jgi:hypothetical protein
MILRQASVRYSSIELHPCSLAKRSFRAVDFIAGFSKVDKFSETVCEPAEIFLSPRLIGHRVVE